MAVLDKKGLSGFVGKLLDLVFIGGICIYIGLPTVLKLYLQTFQDNKREQYYFLLFFLYFTGLFCLWIIFEMQRIFKTLNRRNPFMMDNVISLKRMSTAAFIITAAYIIKIIFYTSLLTIVIAMIFIIAGLFLVILAEVFRQAVEFKEENDLTI